MSSSPADGGALQIFINRRPVDAAAALGLAAGGSATGADIAGLAGIPADNAVVEWQAGPDDIRPVGREETVSIAPGMQFLVTREFVLGGAAR